MARRLAVTGHRVTVWNRTTSTAQAVAASVAGARIQVAGTAAEAVRGRRFVVSMLSDGDATCAVLLHASVVAELRPGTVVFDLATSGPAAARALSDAFAAAGVLFLDAPVSGSVGAVETGTLLVMAAGEPEALERGREVLAAVSDRIAHVGAAGAGQAMKLAVNLVVHDLNASMAESLRLAEKSGITRESAYDILEQSVVGAPFVRYKRAAFLDPEQPVAMSLALSAKDLRLITGLADTVGVEVPVTAAVLHAVESACAHGLAAADMAAMSRLPDAVG